MGMFTHHIDDNNVDLLTNGYAIITSGFDKGQVMFVTDSGYLQPFASVRVRRVLFACIAAMILMGARWLVAGGHDITEFFTISQFGNQTINTTLTLLSVIMVMVAVHIAVFQNATVYANFPGWNVVNSIMMAIFFVMVTIALIAYAVYVIIILIDGIGSLFDRARSN